MRIEALPEGRRWETQVRRNRSPSQSKIEHFAFVGQYFAANEKQGQVSSSLTICIFFLNISSNHFSVPSFVVFEKINLW